VRAALRILDGARGNVDQFRTLFAEYRAMTAQSVRTKVQLGVPDLGLKAGQALPLTVVRRDLATGHILGGIGLVIAGAER
jgi:hypothetical protein